MRILKIIIFFIAPLLAQADTVYKSVGPDGGIIYSDRPPADSKIEKNLIFNDSPSSPLPEYVIRYKEELEKRLQKSSQEIKQPGDSVQLFIAQWCGYCRKAKAYLATRKIDYREYDIDTADGMQAFAQAGGGKGVPLLLWRGQRISGFTKANYDALFGAQ